MQKRLSGGVTRFWALIVAAIICIFIWMSKYRFAHTRERLTARDIREGVDIVREPNGVVHIQAKNEEDLFFAQGLVHAQDRLWQMEFQRRTGAGRLAEILGRAVVERDKFLRTWGFYRAAEAAYEGLSPQTKKVLHAYVAGINFYLTSGFPLPFEFKLLRFKPELWTPVDVVVWSKMMSFSLSNNWNLELQRYELLARGVSAQRIAELTSCAIEDALVSQLAKNLSQPEKEDHIDVSMQTLPELPLAPEASNNWVVTGKRTITGKPLLANDPHLSLSVPSLWYLIHLETPQLNIRGASLPGIPAVTIGCNNFISWGITNALADVQDLYILEETPDHAGYMYKNEILPYQMREEIIRVKKQGPVRIMVRESVYGPVVSDTLKVPGTKPIALRWVSLETEDGSLDAHLGINRATNWREFKAALQKHVAPCMNFVYADVEGNIGHIAPGKIPTRKPGHSGLYPVPGTGEWDWQGFIPFTSLPQTFNPPDGMIVTANNDITPPDYPYTICHDWGVPFRVERIKALLQRKELLSREDMATMQQDSISSLYHAFRPLIEQITPRSEHVQYWHKRLLTWDGDTHPDSQEATIFELWYIELTRLPQSEIQQDFWDRPRYFLNMMRGKNSTDQTAGISYEAYATLAFERTLERLDKQIPVWGKLHEARFHHPILTHTPFKWLSNRHVPFGGDQSTINVGTFSLTTCAVDYAPTCRMVIDLDDVDASLFMYPMGQSGNPFSRHYANFLHLWKKGEYVTIKTRGYKTFRKLHIEPYAVI